LKKSHALFNEKGLPEELLDFLKDIDVLITLKYKNQYIHLNIAKNRDYPVLEEMPLRLDPATFLMA